MKKILFAILFLIGSNGLLFSQVTENSGKPLAEIFADFHYNMTGTEKTTGFGITRAQFGYNYFATQNLSALIKLDIGNSKELAPGSKERRYAYFREASITYSKDKLRIAFGITSTGLYELQQKFIGKRYIADTFQSLNCYGFVADLGISATYKFSDKVEADISLMNGKGYSSIQFDDNIKPSAGITIYPVKNMVIRAVGDIMKGNDLWQATFVLFTGYKNDFMTIGADINYKKNLILLQGHNAWGISGTGAVSLTKKIEFFTRYDYSTSVIVPGEAIQWNIASDSQLLISGFQYTFNKYVRVALDYQATFPTDKTRSFSDLLYINSVFKF